MLYSAEEYTYRDSSRSQRAVCTQSKHPGVTMGSRVEFAARDSLPDGWMLAGTLVREFKHQAVDMFIIEEDGSKKLKVEAHFGKRKALASIRTVCSHVQV